MTINDVLNTIKRKLGSTHMVLPISDEDIIDIIKSDTLPTFSSYFPYFKHIRLTNVDKIASGMYIIPCDEFNIYGVSKVYPLFLGYDDPRYNGYNAPQDIFSTIIANDLGNMTSQPITFSFYPPNKVEIFPKFYRQEYLDIEIKTIHPDNLLTIPISLKDEFIKLALIDTKASIFPILRNYDQINTPYGTLNLNISDYENMEDKRKDLEDIWMSKFMKEPNRRKIFVG